jgi:hypothetical protein
VNGSGTAEDVLSAERWRRALFWAGALAFLCTLAGLGYRLVYAQFQSYDDEGYLLVTVQQFLQGAPLYDAVYSQYGPAYYLWQQILHGIIGVPLTHDATRLVTLAIWLVCSVLAGLPVWLLTRRTLLTAIAVTFAFIHLTPLTFEPGHPQELCLLAVLGVVTIALWRVLVHGRVGVASAASIGALVAVTALTKVNVGAFLVCAMALALVTSVRGFLGRRAVVATTTVFIAVATLIPLRNHLLRSDVAAFVIIIWSGLFAAFVADRDPVGRKGIVTVKELVACLAGLAVSSMVIVIAIIRQGTSLQGLFDGLFVSPLHFPTDLFWTRVPVSPAAACLSLLWPLAAICLRRNTWSIRHWMPYVKITMGRVVCLLSITNWFNPLLAIGTPYASALLGEVHLDARQGAARRVLAFTAILMALQVYPMPGTQVALGTLLLLPIALVLIPEAEHELNRPRTASRIAFFGVDAPGLIMVAMLAIFAGARIQHSVSSGIPLRMPGAENVRSGEADVAAYGWLTANLREHCDRFITAPGFNSLHLWTGIPPVSSLNTTVWPVLLDNAQQEQIVEAAAPVERLCVVASGPAMRHLLAGPDTASRPLASFIAREFETRASYGEWQFRVRHGSQPLLLNQARWIEKGGLVLELPSLGNQRLRRIEVVDVDAERTLADSTAEGVTMFDEYDAPLQIHGDIDLSRRRRLEARFTVQSPDPEHAVVVRLWGDDDGLLATVPVVTVVKEGYSPASSERTRRSSHLSSRNSDRSIIAR